MAFDMLPSLAVCLSVSQAQSVCLGMSASVNLSQSDTPDTALLHFEQEGGKCVLQVLIPKNLTNFYEDLQLYGDSCKLIHCFLVWKIW